MRKQAPDKLMRGTVSHSLGAMSRNLPIKQITRSCILKGCGYGKFMPYRMALKLQQAMRCQYYRAIDKNPKSVLNLTYSLNCMPCGFDVIPTTCVCWNPKVCPWCFARRLLKVYDTLMAPSVKIRNLQRLIVWKRKVEVSAKLPFFRPDCGPHVWCNATVTVQMVVPSYNVKKSCVEVTHIGFQLIPRSNDIYQRQLTRTFVNPPLGCIQYEQVTRDSVIEAFSSSLSLPWSVIYDKDNFDVFMQLKDMYPNRKLLRISR